MELWNGDFVSGSRGFLLSCHKLVFPGWWVGSAGGFPGLALGSRWRRRWGG